MTAILMLRQRRFSNGARGRFLLLWATNQRLGGTQPPGLRLRGV